jgi:hypothetical protein
MLGVVPMQPRSTNATSRISCGRRGGGSAPGRRKAADEKLREALVTVQSTAERFVRETLDSAKAAIEDASRQIPDSARADVQENSWIAAEAAARPVAEPAARAASEQVVRETLGAAREEEACDAQILDQPGAGASKYS